MTDEPSPPCVARLQRCVERRRHSEAGDTLIEVLLALAVIGLTVVSILGAFATSISATSEHRTLATADAAVRSFAETFTYDAHLSSSPHWVGCATTRPLPAPYESILTSFNGSPAANGYTIAITQIANEGTCPATNGPAQLITITASLGRSVDDTLQFVTSAPDQPQTSISTAMYTISPTSAAAKGGGTITVTATTGTPFAGGTTANTTVNFGSNPQPAASVSSTAVTATIPPEVSGLFGVFISVTTPLGTTAPGPFDFFTYGPTVTNLSSTGGTPAGGQQVIITGTGFTANSTVRFGTNQVAAGLVQYRGSATLAVTSPPAGALGTVDVTVTNLALPASVQTSPTSLSDNYTYGMTISSVSPTTGLNTGGTSVTINGFGFTGVTNVTFQGVPAASFNFVSDAQVTAVSPPGAGLADIQVTTPSGTTSKGPGDQFTYTGAGSTVVGLGIQVAGGSPTPTLNCNYRQNGNNSCTISGVGCGGSATFYVESIDGTGLPVAVTTSGGLGVIVGSPGTPANVTIPQDSWSSYTNGQSVTATVTCAKHASSGSVSFAIIAGISGNNVSTSVRVSS
jgi:hypothetical protein